MIRIASILSNIVSIRVSDKVLFDRCSWLECEKEQLCPKCGKIGKLTKHDSYTRTMIYLSNGKRVETIVSIPRGICKCGKTHAFIPDILIPFSSYSFRFVILILWKFLNRKDTVESFCSKYCIAVQTVYNWMNLFRLHYKEWTSAIKELSRPFNDMLENIMETPAFPYEFYKKSNHSFLQGNAYPHNCRMVFTSE